MQYHRFPGDVGEDAMPPGCGPGAKAGNLYIDKVNRELRIEKEFEKYEPIRNILFLSLINTLEEIIKKKKLKIKEIIDII